jgi:hypothetical protein
MLSPEQAAIIKGMLARGDYQHDIAAQFGENPGRIAAIKNGEKYPEIKAAPFDVLPPPLKKTPRFTMTSIRPGGQTAIPTIICATKIATVTCIWMRCRLLRQSTNDLV